MIIEHILTDTNWSCFDQLNGWQAESPRIDLTSFDSYSISGGETFYPKSGYHEIIRSLWASAEPALQTQNRWIILLKYFSWSFGLWMTQKASWVELFAEPVKFTKRVSSLTLFCSVTKNCLGPAALRMLHGRLSTSVVMSPATFLSDSVRYISSSR